MNLLCGVAKIFHLHPVCPFCPTRHSFTREGCYIFVQYTGVSRALVDSEDPENQQQFLRGSCKV